MRTIEVVSLRAGVGTADVGHNDSPIPISVITIETEGLYVNAPDGPESVYLLLALGSDQVADLLPLLTQFTKEVATPFAQLQAANIPTPTEGE